MVHQLIAFSQTLQRLSKIPFSLRNLEAMNYDVSIRQANAIMENCPDSLSMHSARLALLTFLCKFLSISVLFVSACLCLFVLIFAHLECMQAGVEQQVLPACQALPQQVMLRADPHQPCSALQPAMHVVALD